MLEVDPSDQNHHRQEEDVYRKPRLRVPAA